MEQRVPEEKTTVGRKIKAKVREMDAKKKLLLLAEADDISTNLLFFYFTYKQP